MYPGTVLLVSHDRHLIRSVSGDLLEVRNGRAVRHSGVDEAVLTPSFQGGVVGPGSDAAAVPSTKRPARNQARSAEPDASSRPSKKVAREDRARKRDEAEDRQARHRATKDLRRSVDRIEKQLAEAEREVAELNRQLADPEVYGDPERVAELSKTFGLAKDRAAALMDEWTDASMRLESTQGA